jgi:hypothetical protein
MRIAGKRPKPPILLLIPYTYLGRLLGFGPISSYLGLGMILLLYMTASEIVANIFYRAIAF